MADASTVVALYVRLRDEIEARDEKHKESIRPLKEKLETLNTQLLGYLQAAGVDNIKITGVGTAYKKKVVSATVPDWSVTLAWIIENKQWDAINAGINKTFATNYVTKHEEPPPGVNYSVTVDVGVRRATGT